MKKIKRKIINKLSIKGQYKITTLKSGTNEVLRETEYLPNLVVSNTNNGLNLLLLAMRGDETYGIKITQAKIGTGSTATTDNDTDLETTVLSGIGVGLYNTNSTVQLLIKFFMSDADLANDDYNEFGIFCGTQLFARSIISPAHTKGSNEDTIISYLVNFSNT